MSKLTDRMARVTNNIVVKGDVKTGTDEAASPAAKTGPGVFMKATFGREEAEQARFEAEQALNELKQSRIIKITDLVEITGRKRILTPEEFGELKRNLEHHRLINPITIRKHAAGGYEIVAGHNRVQAYRELGRETIEANLLEFSETEALSAAFYTNLFSPALTHYEQFKGFSALQNLTGKAQVVIAQESGLSAAHISNILSFDGLPDDAKSLLNTKPWILGSVMAARFASLAKEGRADKVNEAVRQLYENESLTEKAALEMIKGKSEQKAHPKANILKVGQKKFADITTRNGAILIKFADKDNADRWAEKITEFVRGEIAKGGV